MKVLITGGTGFLAGKLANALLGQGHEVRLLVRTMPDARDERVTYTLGDLHDIPSLDAACAGMDWVFHTAGVISYNPKKADLLYQTNVIGTRHLVAAALRQKVKRFIHTSSTAAIGVSTDPSRPMNESTPFNAGSLGLAYFTTKHEAEQEVLKGVAQGLDAVILNPGSLLGPGDMRRMEKGYVGLIYKYKPMFRFHGGINFVDVNDVVRGHLAAAERGRTGERYILGGENLSFGDLIVRVNAILGRPAPRLSVPREMMGVVAGALKLLNFFGVDIHMTPELVRQVSSWYLYVDSSKAQRELGYQPHRINQAVSETMEWLREKKRLV